MADRPVNNGASRRLLLLRRVLACGPPPAFDQLCRVTAEVTGTTGASIVLLERGVVTGLLASSDPVASQLEALEHLLGEGPSVEAHEQGVVVQAELGSEEPRYNAYEHQAVSLGVALRPGGGGLGLGRAHLRDVSWTCRGHALHINAC